jgi:hypothetical protein
LCRSEVLALLAHVAFGGGDRFGEVFANRIDCEARPRGEVASINGLEPSGRNWAEASSMQVSYDVLFDCELLNVVGGWLIVKLWGKWYSGRQGAGL